MATLIELLDLTRRELVEAVVKSAGGKLSRKPDPIRLEHPGRLRAKRRPAGEKPRTNWADVARFFGMDYDPARAQEAAHPSA